ncbi:helix-turn-helix domain-containing protein [Pseudonocardia kongjuensis]|uniref:Helix-turn-helix domain-containing protein n=1 Tax=Pseudonocardia kongjuensis TaxID=102227 RepID=A0ABN1XQJ9_9PSEU
MSEVTPWAPAEFSTAGLPEHRRLALWEDHNADALIGLRCRTITGRALDASEINGRLGRLHLARVRGSAHVVERDQELIRRRPTDSVGLFFSLAGEAFFYHDDGVRTVRPGQLLMCDADRPFLRGFSRGLEELVVRIPRGLFRETSGIDAPREPVLRDFAPGADPVAEVLARRIGAAVRTDDPRPVDEATVLDLVAALGPTGRGAAAATHRAVAQSYVERHLADPGLSAPQVAAAAGISVRHLSRVFAAAGTSFPRFVLDHRLEAAHRLLRGPAGTALTVAEIAGRCGFRGTAHFAREFTARFGERPSQVRRRAAAARTVCSG